MNHSSGNIGTHKITSWSKQKQNLEFSLIQITNDPHVARIAEQAGVSHIMVDLEFMGKVERQGHLDTLISNHSMKDVEMVKKILQGDSQVIVRVNPLHPQSNLEIDQAISAGADMIMLPMFQSARDVEMFVNLIKGRAQSILLLETPQALVRVDSILKVQGIDRIHIGLNDLHIGLGLDFLFELLTSGLIDYVATKIVQARIPFGFGGIARIGEGLIPAENILREHVRLGSTMAILSRTFMKGDPTKVNTIHNYKFEEFFPKEIQKIRHELLLANNSTGEELQKNQKKICNLVESHINSFSDVSRKLG